jgi:hypothetical protein
MPDITWLLTLVIWIIVVGLIFWLLRYAVNTVLPEPMRAVANVILTVLAVLILIYVLMGFLPLHPYPYHAVPPR